MHKIHTRQKRKMERGTGLSHKNLVNGGKRKKRPKTFLTEERAREWARENGIKKFELVNVKKDKKFMVKEL